MGDLCSGRVAALWAGRGDARHSAPHRAGRRAQWRRCRELLPDCDDRRGHCHAAAGMGLARHRFRLSAARMLHRNLCCPCAGGGRKPWAWRGGGACHRGGGHAARSVRHAAAPAGFHSGGCDRSGGGDDRPRLGHPRAQADLRGERGAGVGTARMADRRRGARDHGVAVRMGRQGVAARGGAGGALRRVPCGAAALPAIWRRGCCRAGVHCGQVALAAG